MPLSILPAFLQSVCRRSWTRPLRTLVRAGIGLAALAALAPQALASAVATQIALTGSGSSILGQPVTFTVQVTPTQAPQPTGYVVVGDLNDLTLLVTEPLGANGQATFSSSRLAPGKNSLYAAYSGDKFHLPSYTGTPLVWTEYAATTTTLAPGTGSSVYGQPVVFTATVASGVGNLTGLVSFLANGAPIGSATVTKTGRATLTVATLPVGANQSITARYGGDGSHAPSSASAVDQTVTQDATTTSSLTTCFSSPGVGAQVTYTVSVTPNTPGGGTPTGTVTFQDTSTTPPTTLTGTLGNGTASSAPTASATFTFLTQGSHPITAVYGGDADFTGSTAPAFTQVVQATGTEPVTVTLSLAAGSPSTFVFGQPVTLTVTVTGNGTIPPTGTVTIYDTIGDPTTIQVEELPLPSSGSLTTTLTNLPTGSGTLSASFGGDGYYEPGDTGSASAPAVTVVPANSTTQVSSSFNPSGSGATVTFTAVVQPTVGSTIAIPTGQVTFAIDGVTAPSTATAPNPVTLPAGSASASYSTSALPYSPSGPAVQTHSITASYSGDKNFNPSSNLTTPYPQGVQAVGTYPVTVGVALNTDSSSPGYSTDPSVFGQSVTFLATVADASPSPTPGLLEPTPQGSVVFQVNGLTATGQVALDSTGSASFSTTLLPFGGNSITANYLGDDYYAGTQPTDFPGITQTVIQDSTTISLSVPPAANPSTYGAADVTFTATVQAVAPGSGTPTGSVTFYDTSTSPATQLGTLALVGGTASFTPPAPGLSVGLHTITATYSGDTNFQTSSTSTPLAQTVNSGTVNTATQVYLSSGTPTTTSTDTFTVNVSSAAGSPTGSVTFSDDAGDTFLPNPATLSGGTATSSCSALTAGTRTVTAAYTPDTGSFDGSSGSASLFVSRSTSTSLAATTSATSATAPGQLDVYFDENVTLTATVTDASPSGTVTPTGTVTFYETTPSSTVIPYGPYPLDSNGTASFSTAFTTSTFSPITNTFQAVYNPNPGPVAQFISSDSLGLQVIETPTESTETALTASSYSINAGQSITFTATVTDTTGPYTPGGTVTFYDTNLTLGSAQTALGTATLDSSGVATLSTTSLTPGNHDLCAVFSSTGFVGSQYGPITVTVNALTSQISPTLSPATSPFASTDSFTLQATVAPVSPDGYIPSGSVSFFSASSNNAIGFGITGPNYNGGGGASNL